MTKEKKDLLLFLLYEYSEELVKECNGNCDCCESGILESYGSGYSCSVDTVIRNLERQP